MLGRMALAVVVFVVFGGLTWAMARSVARDLKEGRRRRDGVSLFSGLEGLLPVAIAGVTAVIGPIVILLNG